MKNAKWFITVLMVVTVVVTAFSVRAQVVLDSQMKQESVPLKDAPMFIAVTLIGNAYDAKVICQSTLSEERITLNGKNVTINEVLNKIAADHNWEWKQIGKNTYFIGTKEYVAKKQFPSMEPNANGVRATIPLNDTPINIAITMIGKNYNVRLIAGKGVADSRISMIGKDVTLKQVLNQLAIENEWVWKQIGKDTYLVDTEERMKNKKLPSLESDGKGIKATVPLNDTPINVALTMVNKMYNVQIIPEKEIANEHLTFIGKDITLEEFLNQVSLENDWQWKKAGASTYTLGLSEESKNALKAEAKAEAESCKKQAMQNVPAKTEFFDLGKEGQTVQQPERRLSNAVTFSEEMSEWKLLSILKNYVWIEHPSKVLKYQLRVGDSFSATNSKGQIFEIHLLSIDKDKQTATFGYDKETYTMKMF